MDARCPFREGQFKGLTGNSWKNRIETRPNFSPKFQGMGTGQVGCPDSRRCDQKYLGLPPRDVEIDPHEIK